MLLTNLLERLDAYGENVDVRAETRDTLRCLRLLQREQLQSVPPIISSFARMVTPYAVTLLQAQWLQSLHYSVGSNHMRPYETKFPNSTPRTAALRAAVRQDGERAGNVSHRLAWFEPTHICPPVALKEPVGGLGGQHERYGRARRQRGSAPPTREGLKELQAG